jgi:FkbM family methyltransferase
LNPSLKALASKTPLYPIYRRLADWRRERRMIRDFQAWSAEDQQRFDFYRQFIAQGDVVFDVGANMGNRSKIFSTLGAVVVAVEPQTACLRFLRSVFQDKANVHLVGKALGASVGQAEMLISNACEVSSLSEDWVRTVRESGRFGACEWSRKETVSIETLDNLIAQFGRPAFIKIDVEGFEEEVVSGLSTPVAMLSLEFTPEFIDSTIRCIDHLSRIGNVRFQWSVGESMKFALPEWVGADEIRGVLSKIEKTEFGDLYARFDDHSLQTPGTR